MRIRSSALTLVLAAVLASAGLAHAKSPVQLGPDDSTTILMVNKQPPGTTEQWVLVLDADNLILTGNVFDTSGKPPTFFYCDVEFDPDEWLDPADIASETLTLTCQVAGGCTTLPCTSDWQPVGTDISLPGMFFLP